MELSPEAIARYRELERTAPIRPRSVWVRDRFGSADAMLLCGTIGAEFDTWQRRLAALSAADAFFSQRIGLRAVELVMDELESRLRAAVESEGGRLLPRWSPGYPGHPLELSREILARLDASRRIGVSFTDSQLLVPSKTVTAVCEIVPLPDC